MQPKTTVFICISMYVQRVNILQCITLHYSSLFALSAVVLIVEVVVVVVSQVPLTRWCFGVCHSVCGRTAYVACITASGRKKAAKSLGRWYMHVLHASMYVLTLITPLLSMLPLVRNFFVDDALTMSRGWSLSES